jgi:hypothetical protein
MEKKKLLLSISLLFSIGINSQNNSDKFWSPITESNIKAIGKRQIIPQKYLTIQLNGSELKNQLLTAPHEKNVTVDASSCVVSIPLPNGTLQRFRVVESPIMEDGLALQFPNIKTYSVKGIDDPYANGKLDWNEFGFHGMVRSVNGDFFIDPYSNLNISDYVSYYTADFIKDPSQKIPESELIQEEIKLLIKKQEVYLAVTACRQQFVLAQTLEDTVWQLPVRENMQ